MTPKAILTLVVMLLAFNCASRAQPAPATKPVDVPGDQSTPRGALNVLAIAMDEGDGAKIRKVLQTSNPQEEQVVDSLVNLHGAVAKFGKAVIAAFGENDARKIVGDKAAAQAQMIEELRAMPEEIKGDTATVGGSDKNSQFHLKKVDGKWVIPLGAWVGADSPEKLQEIADDKNRRAAIFTGITKELNEDTYKSVDEAFEALQLKLMRAAMEKPGGATQPSTQPTAPGAPS